jgi:ribosomal protein S18 acetylase RimI-like enzyme
MTAIRVRRARRGDAAAVSAFCLALGEHEQTPGRRFTPKAFLRDAFGRNPRFIVLVAERDGAVVGYVLATPSYESNWAASGFYVGDVYVAPKARRCGVGRRLIAALAVQARGQGREYPWWTTLPGNSAARRFYRAIGATTQELRAHVIARKVFRQLADESVKLPADDAVRGRPLSGMRR